MSKHICPACSFSLFHIKVLIPDRLLVLECRGCRLLMSHIYNNGHAGYEIFDPDVYENSIAFVRKKQATNLVELVKRRKNNGRWFDVGCGVGLLLQAAKENGYEVLGIDPDPVACQNAWKVLGKSRVLHGEMNEDSIPNDSQDIISCLDLLEHIPVAKVDSFLEIIRAKLRKGGKIVIKVPSSEGLYFTLIHRARDVLGEAMFNFVKRFWLLEYEYPHTFYFNADALSSLLEKHRFRLEVVTYLEEIPTRTIFDRIRLDKKISAPVAVAALPFFLGVNLVEKIRGKTDALLVIAEVKK